MLRDGLAAWRRGPGAGPGGLRPFLLRDGTGRTWLRHGATGGPSRPRWGRGRLGLTGVRGAGRGPGRCRAGQDRTGPDRIDRIGSDRTGPVRRRAGLPRRRAPKLSGCTTRPVTCRGGANRRSRDVSAQQLRGCGAARGVRAVQHGQAPRGVRAAERRHG